MYCGYCGKKISDDVIFCPYCGTKIVKENRNSEDKKVDNSIRQVNDQTSDNESRRNTNNRGKRLAEFVAFAIFLFYIGYKITNTHWYSSSSQDVEQSYEEDQPEEDIQDQPEVNATQQNVTGEVDCPMCGGTGMISYMEGDVMAPETPCNACNQNGKVTVAEAEKLRKDMEKVNAMFGDTGSGNRSSERESGRQNTAVRQGCRLCNSPGGENRPGDGKCKSCGGSGINPVQYTSKELPCTNCYGIYGDRGSGLCSSCKGTGWRE